MPQNWGKLKSIPKLSVGIKKVAAKNLRKEDDVRGGYSSNLR